MIALATCIVHRNAILLSGTAQAVTKATNELYTRFGYLWQLSVARYLWWPHSSQHPPAADTETSHLGGRGMGKRSRSSPNTSIGRPNSTCYGPCMVRGILVTRFQTKTATTIRLTTTTTTTTTTATATATTTTTTSQPTNQPTS